MNPQGGMVAFGAAIVAFVTEMIMKATPEKFDRNRFAPLCNLVLALGLSITEGVLKSGIGIYDAIIRGLIMAMGSAGVYDITKTYGGKVVKVIKNNN